MAGRFETQRGFAYVRYSVVTLAVAFFSLLAYKLAPIYFENITLKNTIQGMRQLPGLDEKSERKWIAELQNQFDINNVHRVKARDLSVEKEDSNVVVQLQYEVRVDLLSNIDMVISFDQKFKVPFGKGEEIEVS